MVGQENRKTSRGCERSARGSRTTVAARTWSYKAVTADRRACCQSSWRTRARVQSGTFRPRHSPLSQDAGGAGDVRETPEACRYRDCPVRRSRGRPARARGNRSRPTSAFAWTVTSGVLYARIRPPEAPSAAPRTLWRQVPAGCRGSRSTAARPAAARRSPRAIRCMPRLFCGGRGGTGRSIRRRIRVPRPRRGAGGPGGQARDHRGVRRSGSGTP